MENEKPFRLSRAPISLRVLVTCFILALSLAYGVALLQINNRSEFKMERAISHFRGAPEEIDELRMPQSNATMISVAHVHSFSQPALLGLMGLLLVFTGLSEKKKIFWILASFFGSLMTNVSPWLIRDVSPRFVFLIYVAGVMMFLSFAVMAVVVMAELWTRKKADHV